MNYVPTTGKRIIGMHKVRSTVVLFTSAIIRISNNMILSVI